MYRPSSTAPSSFSGSMPCHCSRVNVRPVSKVCPLAVKCISPSGLAYTTPPGSDATERADTHACSMGRWMSLGRLSGADPAAR